ncbi:hypothetical protein Btru_009393 [Bulinus truncatus]|nr:hypothetical protein Btru_009393 [Bulinus truncatus]
MKWRLKSRERRGSVIVASLVTMETKIVLFLLLALGCTVNANVGNTTQRFQADKFLDMLSRSFDPNVAYTDLMAALNKRLKSDNATGGGVGPVDSNPSLMVDSVAHCPEAPTKPGASVTYTSDNRVVGSRAFYQCEAGYEGRSLFIQCTNGGVWSTPTGWEGCKAVDMSNLAALSALFSGGGGSAGSGATNTNQIYLLPDNQCNPWDIEVI